jgi:hypothetical protein
VVVTRIDEALQTLILFDNGACPAAKPAISSSAPRGFGLTQHHRTLTALGITIELEQVAVIAAPRGMERSKDFPHIVSR